MLKKTFTAAITAAVLLSAGAAMAAPDANWAFSKEAVEVLKTKNGYITIKKIEAEDPATGIWKAEGVKKIDGVEVEVETTLDHTGKVISEKKD
ncbi:PepSY domain-containing protein [Pseudomonas lundensis]|uniref:PepSY domain-containing protein n=1 Tax=Pseudomonas lundensis TaxID=86185 RepID=UPI00385CE749